MMILKILNSNKNIRSIKNKFENNHTIWSAITYQPP